MRQRPVTPRWPRGWLEDAARAKAQGLPIPVADRTRMEVRTTLDALRAETPKRTTYMARDGRRRCWRECWHCEGTGMDPYSLSLAHRLREVVDWETYDPTCEACQGGGGEWYAVKLLPPTAGQRYREEGV